VTGFFYLIWVRNRWALTATRHVAIDASTSTHGHTTSRPLPFTITSRAISAK
jgi:hypothetical protein